MIPIAIRDDSYDENTEVFEAVLTLESASGNVRIDPDLASIFIEDDDGMFNKT